MKITKRNLLFSLFLVLAVALSACAPAATPEPTAMPATAVPATAAPTAVPATAAASAPANPDLILATTLPMLHTANPFTWLFYLLPGPLMDLAFHYLPR